VSLWERQGLVAFLGGLAPEEWVAPTAARGWTIKDLALHLLDDDLTWLSVQRDGDDSGLVDMSDRSRLVELLAGKNQRFLDGGQSLSRRVVIDMLDWSGDQVDGYHAACDLRGEGWASWASNDPVPFWFNLAQEFTERWVHQQQMREAVDRVENHTEHLPELLRTFVWALPHQLPVPDDAGMVITVTIDQLANWTLTPTPGKGWSLTHGPAEHPTAALRFSPDAAWRWLVGAGVPADQVTATGPQDLTNALMSVRAIIV
jgi:hypothetical protein